MCRVSPPPPVHNSRHSARHQPQEALSGVGQTEALAVAAMKGATRAGHFARVSAGDLKTHGPASPFLPFSALALAIASTARVVPLLAVPLSAAHAVCFAPALSTCASVQHRVRSDTVHSLSLSLLPFQRGTSRWSCAARGTSSRAPWRGATPHSAPLHGLELTPLSASRLTPGAT